MKPWGYKYGAGARTRRDRELEMRRKGARARWYDNRGRQVGPEQPGVCGAITYTMHNGWAL